MKIEIDLKKNTIKFHQIKYTLNLLNKFNKLNTLKYSILEVASIKLKKAIKKPIVNKIILF
jgi:hypothetical protein